MVDKLAEGGDTHRDSSKVIIDLLKIQEMIYEQSEFKTGPKAGKVTSL
jgi:hypothetical protein